MKLALISDVHSNLEALTAALQTIQQREVDAIYCLGDVVGYGSDASACVDLVQRMCKGVVRGNHDEAVALRQGVEMLPRDGQKAVKHNREQLLPTQLDWLANLPLVLEADGCTFAHASPMEPELWHRIGSFMLAKAQFDFFNTDVCFIGHTHIPAVMSNRLGVLRVRPGHRYLINIGSVGQPRDGNPRLCVAFFDTETFDYELLRVPYNVEQTASKIRRAKLPSSLGERLKMGR